MPSHDWDLIARSGEHLAAQIKRVVNLSIMTANANPFEADLSRLSGGALDAYLSAHSGLPGPRANLALADACAQVLDTDELLRLAASDDEFLALCGSVGVGEQLARGAALESVLKRLASDGRWRVREGVARGLQRLGDAAPERLAALVLSWAEDRDPLVQRAAIGGACEPRLLKNPVMAEAAIRSCTIATDALLAHSDRRSEPVRVLRQALGYCWSVAIAGDPGEGLRVFARLRENQDADAQWIVRENLKKARLARLL